MLYSVRETRENVRKPTFTGLLQAWVHWACSWPGCEASLPGGVQVMGCNLLKFMDLLLEILILWNHDDQLIFTFFLTTEFGRWYIVIDVQKGKLHAMHQLQRQLKKKGAPQEQLDDLKTMVDVINKEENSPLFYKSNCSGSGKQSIS